MIQKLIIGWILDLILGDPERLPHPIVYMGKWIAFGEKRLNKDSHRLAKGAMFATSSILLTFALIYLLMYATDAFLPEYVGWAVGGILVFFCLAGHTLRKEVRMVFEAVDRSVEDGRKQVGRIVGRDTSELTAQECRTAALETLAENLSDGVIAPLFWYLLLGVPGMMAYKMINTLDSMIGYQNARYKDFGCWAAHIDDIANYIPARLSALLIIIAYRGHQLFTHPTQGASAWSLIRFTLHFGPQHASPNSGWPEAALAGVLDCRFGGPHNYFGEYFYKPFIGTTPRLLTTAHMQLSIRIMVIAECIMIGIIAAILIFT